MAWDSHTTVPPSAMTGTRPWGFMARKVGASSPPNAPPAGMCSWARPSSPTSHITFCTLNELRRPQILSIAGLASRNDAPRWVRGTVAVKGKSREGAGAIALDSAAAAFLHQERAPRRGCGARGGAAEQAHERSQAGTWIGLRGALYARGLPAPRRALLRAPQGSRYGPLRSPHGRARRSRVPR